MKKLFVLFVLIPLFSFNSSISDEQIIGKWEGKDEKTKVGAIIFRDDGYVTVEIDGQAFGGEEFELEGNRVSMTYEINRKVNPIEIDFIITSLDTKTEMRMLIIAEFKDKDTMTIASNFNEVRPTEFNIKNSIKLHRIH
ncbi:MAG: hypothetical protein GYB35_07305 [Algicola sp.]|nr:hypothetical protein [Algicola sp.]